VATIPADGRIVRRTLTAARASIARAGFAIGRRFPVRRRVVLATAHADRIAGNLAEIHAGIAADLSGAEVVVLARRVRPGVLGALLAAVDAVVAGWHLGRAALFVVDDYFFPMDVVRRRPGTRYVQVWHAAGAFKKFGYSTLDKSFGASASETTRFPIHTNYDLCLVSAERFVAAYAEAFRQPVERFTSRYGIPRTDLFFDEARIAAVSEAIRARYGLPAPGERHLVLYAPTFRGTTVTNARQPRHLDLAALRQRLGDDHVVLLRAHPFVREALRLGPELEGFVVDVSDWPELNELMLVSDVLVTDYSSAMYEFALLGRPIGFFTPDQAEYERERGFYLRFPDDLPGPAFTTTEALAEWLAAGRFDLERVRRFAAESFDVADGRSTARFVDEVVRPALEAPAGSSRPR
jgi:CDP-ribitol ribitolphosphotransferase